MPFYSQGFFSVALLISASLIYISLINKTSGVTHKDGERNAF